MTKNLIRVGELKRGVFVYKDGLKANAQVNKATSQEVWHHKIGHPSRQALSKVSSDIPFDSFSEHREMIVMCACVLNNLVFLFLLVIIKHLNVLILYTAILVVANAAS